MKTHQFHLVNPSFWPFLASLSAFILVLGGVFYMHEMPIGKIIMPVGFLLVFYTMYVWWRDVVREARIDKAHSSPVRTGLRMGMSFFILSEIMFFFAFFFAFFHSWIFPVDILDDVWPVKEGIWPPENIKIIDPWSVPFLNTLILLLSGTTVTWAHHSLINNDNDSLVRALKYSVILGLIFTGFQAYEYHHALAHNFNFTETNYGANFYLATGFHGFHVIVGTIFLLVCYFRAKSKQFNKTHHLGFEFAAWYWHFVDVVWLFLFAVVYVFGS
ncbi:MAG: cytochrome c oxidase subunit 3 [Rickettsiales bacterium]|nr:cytochrome c oxidase subunit 3 [Rickettsiales bacterium]